MERLAFASILVLAMPCAAFGNDLSFTLNPAAQTYPPTYDPAICEVNSGTTQPCLLFLGTLTDTDTDGSYLSLYSLTLDFTNDPQDSAYFTVDNAFYNDVPGSFVGDPNAATDGSPVPNTYTGPIFGLDIDPSTPSGEYNLTAAIEGAGGTGDPTYSGFIEEAQFAVFVVPEPASFLMVFAALLVIALLRARIPRRC